MVAVAWEGGLAYTPFVEGEVDVQPVVFMVTDFLSFISLEPSGSAQGADGSKLKKWLM